MKIVVIIIMTSVGFSFLLKLTCHRLPGTIALSLIAALTVIFSYETAASQSKTQIADWLENPQLMLDTSVWLTVDVAFQIYFCFLAAKSLCSPLGRKEKMAYEVCLWFPGILIFPVLFASLTELIFSMPGTDFSTIGWGMAAGVLIFMPLLALGFKWLLPEPEIRIELNFMINLLIAALGIVATVNGRTAAMGVDSVEWTALAGVFALLALGFVAGFFHNKYITRKTCLKINSLK